jgi:hypothetical protein
MFASFTLPTTLAEQIALLKRYGYLPADWVVPTEALAGAVVAWIAMLIYMLVKFFLKK